MTATGSEDYVTEYNYNNAQGKYTALLQKEVKTVEGEENPLDQNSNVKQTVYTYDANGNQVKKVADGKTETNKYDGLNQLIGFTDGDTTASYAYNVDGLRYEKIVDGQRINHVWDGDKQIVADVIDNQFYEADCYIRGTNLVAKYNYRNGDKSEYTYYTQNAHGDVVNLTDKDGKVTKKYTYDAFGVEKNIDKNDVNAFRYCGEYFDSESGTVYLRARYYDPSIGRFISRDSFAGSNNDPLSLNLYTYCHNNPILGTDPTGHFFDTLFDVVSLVVDVVTFCADPTPMGAVDIIADVAGLVIPGVPSAGVKAGVKAVDAAHDAYKAADALHDASKVADATKTIVKNGDNILDAADTAKDLKKASKYADNIGDSATSLIKSKPNTFANGAAGEKELERLYKNGISQKKFSTSYGNRFVDRFSDGIAHESKVGYRSLDKFTKKQVLKDAELLKSGDIKGAEWHFFTSSVTGKGGPSKPLQKMLQSNGIKYTRHY